MSKATVNIIKREEALPFITLEKAKESFDDTHMGVFNLFKDKDFMTNFTKYLKENYSMNDGDIIAFEHLLEIKDCYYEDLFWYKDKILPRNDIFWKGYYWNQPPEIYYPKFALNHLTPEGYFRQGRVNGVWIELNLLKNTIQNYGVKEMQDDESVDFDSFENRYKYYVNIDGDTKDPIKTYNMIEYRTSINLKNNIIFIPSTDNFEKYTVKNQDGVDVVFVNVLLV